MLLSLDAVYRTQAEPESRPGPRGGPILDASNDSTRLQDGVELVDDRSTQNWRPSVPGYDFVRGIATGGQGFVFCAVQRSTKRTVAIKVLQDPEQASEEARRRFEREVELVARLNHPNIVAVFDSGIAPDGRRFCVMDYIAGKPLDIYVREQRLSLEQVFRLFLPVCDAVEHAHERGVVHRDLKPSNILVDADGRPRVLDFGLAKWLAGSADTLVSRTQAFMGTLPYMAPEQARGDGATVSARTDVYALGVVLYKLLVGVYPYPVSGRVVDVIQHIAATPPGSPRSQWTPELGVRAGAAPAQSGAHCPLDRDIETILLKALAKEPARRYQSVAEFARDIAQYLSGRPIEARRDSVVYVLRTRGMSSIRRNPGTACVLVTLLAALLVKAVVDPLVYDWTPVNAMIERSAYPAISPLLAPPVDGMRMVALTDRTDLAALCAQVGLAPGEIERDRKAARRLHAELIRRLTPAEPSVVVLALNMPDSSPHDAALAEAIGELRRSGAELVLAVGTWDRAESGEARVSPALAPLVRWGCAPIALEAPTPWPTLLIAVRREPGETLPSLAAAACAAIRQPQRRADLIIDPETERVRMVYWTPSEVVQGERRVHAGYDEVRASAVRRAGVDVPEVGIRDTDRLAHLLLCLPEASALEGATLDYQDIFTLGTNSLRDWARGKAVFVGDRRDAQHQSCEVAGGRRVWFAQAHATATAALLQGSALRVATVPQSLVWNLAIAVAGAWSGWRLASRPGLRAGAWAVGGILCVGIALAVAAVALVLYNPIGPALTLLASGELAAWVRGVHVSRGEASPAGASGGA